MCGCGAGQCGLAERWEGSHISVALVRISGYPGKGVGVFAGFEAGGCPDPVGMEAHSWAYFLLLGGVLPRGAEG